MGVLLLLFSFLRGSKAHYNSLQLFTYTGCMVKDLMPSAAVLMFVPELSWLLSYINALSANAIQF